MVCGLISPHLSGQALAVKDFTVLVRGNAALMKTTLEEKGFKEIYGGPRKEHGSLYLFHHKKMQEYLFCYADDSGRVEQFNYYLPLQGLYRKMAALKDKNITLTPQGAVRYEDGKKYYQLTIRGKAE